MTGKDRSWAALQGPLQGMQVLSTPTSLLLLSSGRLDKIVILVGLDTNCEATDSSMYRVTELKAQENEGTISCGMRYETRSPEESVEVGRCGRFWSRLMVGPNTKGSSSDGEVRK